MPSIIGLTGGIGSGKSVVTALFRERGADVVDADEIAHRVSRPGGPGAQAVIAAFGVEARAADGSLNRDWLRQQAFADAAFRRKLEGLLHPLIGAAIRSAIATWHGPYGIVSAPLLLERGNLLPLIQRVLVVDAPAATQVERAVARGRLTASDVRAIMATQLSRAQRLARADDIIDNSGTLAALPAQVDMLDRRYRTLAVAGAN
jgi:dephospho-CoA kinase